MLFAIYNQGIRCYNTICSRGTAPRSRKARGISTVGSTLHWQCRGQEFESPMLHHFWSQRTSSNQQVTAGFFFSRFWLKQPEFICFFLSFEKKCHISATFSRPFLFFATAFTINALRYLQNSTILQFSVKNIIFQSPRNQYWLQGRRIWLTVFLHIYTINWQIWRKQDSMNQCLPWQRKAPENKFIPKKYQQRCTPRKLDTAFGEYFNPTIYRSDGPNRAYDLIPF